MIADNNDLPKQSLPQFLYLTTKGRKTSRQHIKEIWFVEYNKRYYILSEHKKTSDWVQNIMADSNVSFKVNNKSYKGYARIVDKNKETILANAVSDLMLSKYGWNDGLIVELTSNDNIK
ncbi:MAG TPA: nitroreductase/quinone reductase family protein [Nitrososphaeraceae archaeon]|nr:nitroreductase/quinone reductase family protein [Nitrososphaeraceae archaeon]